MAKKNVKPELYTFKSLQTAINDIYVQAKYYIKHSLTKHNFDKDAALADWLSFYEVSKTEVIKAFNYPFNLMSVLIKSGQINEPNITPNMCAGLYVNNLLWGRCAVSSLQADPNPRIYHSPANIEVSLKSKNPEQSDNIMIYIPYSREIHKLMIHAMLWHTFNDQICSLKSLMQEE